VLRDGERRSGNKQALCDSHDVTFLFFSSMASSSNLSSSQRRRAHQKKQQLSRSNSSLLSTIKSLVTAPLSWFAGNEEFEDSNGKRRRLASPLDPMSEDEEKASRVKRMRIDSPPADPEHSQIPHTSSSAYLDPPTHAFKPQRTSENSVPRSLSLSIPSSTLQEMSLSSSANNVRSTLSPLRNLGISRTMSVDPPVRALRREPAMANIPLRRDISFESVKNAPHSSVQRELSVPLMPQSSRPSYHLRSSMTPQPLVPPAQRESSEPPPIRNLVINPVFVRAPSSQPVDSRQRSGINQTVTLGSLADLSRSVSIDLRQRSMTLTCISRPVLLFVNTLLCYLVSHNLQTYNVNNAPYFTDFSF
jgi:nucleoporin NUP1